MIPHTLTLIKAYDEDDDGFTFSRVKKSKKPRQSNHGVAPAMTSTATMAEAPGIQNNKPKSRRRPSAELAGRQQDEVENATTAKKRRNKMSFSTPNTKEPVRRSKRLSSETVAREGSPAAASGPAQVKSEKRRKRESKEIQHQRPPEANGTEDTAEDVTQKAGIEEAPEADHSGTKIALPFADTPVIRRNKAMREGKSVKNDRRSSLGLRGRRASSLIDSGNSNGKLLSRTLPLRLIH